MLRSLFNLKIHFKVLYLLNVWAMIIRCYELWSCILFILYYTSSFQPQSLNPVGTEGIFPFVLLKCFVYLFLLEVVTLKS